MTTLSTPEAVTDKPTILVVDDESGPRDALKVILRPFFNVQCAESAGAAIDVLSNQHIDLVTLDQKLPDRQGLDLLQEIKQDHADIEVIIVTGYGSLKSAMEGIRHGAAGYLLKPFNVTELITLVNQTLEKKQRLDYLRRFISPLTDMRGSDNERSRTWEEMRAGYNKIRNVPDDKPDSIDDTTRLLPILSDLLEAKDRQLLNHSSRVSYYSTLVGNRANLSAAEQKSLTFGAFLHDIGKITQESYRYTDHEITTGIEHDDQTTHPEVGAKLVAPLGLPAEVGQIIRYHHERWDGTGYPYALKGEGIPLLARIVCLAQSFDHLTAELQQGSLLTIDEALKFITTRAGTNFDPKLATLFTQVIQECKSSLPVMALAAGQTGRDQS